MGWRFALVEVLLLGHLCHGTLVERHVPLYWQFERSENWVTTGERYQRRYDGKQTIEEPAPSTVLRTGPYVLRGYRSGEPYSVPDCFELFNVVDDPREESELSAAEPKTFSALAGLLVSMHGEVNHDRLGAIAAIESRTDQRH